tara:strand:- start:4984 stop:5322 length:339 start_codon:yes stop_codon:yes gene_type:complete
MSQRYNNRTIIVNRKEMYQDSFEKRGVKKINHYNTPALRYPNQEQLLELQTLSHIWTVGDKFYKLAYDNYGNSKYWWVIAMFNNSPTEAHVQLGEELLIPVPLEKVLFFYGV